MTDNERLIKLHETMARIDERTVAIQDDVREVKRAYTSQSNRLGVLETGHNKARGALWVVGLLATAPVLGKIVDWLGWPK